MNYSENHKNSNLDLDLNINNDNMNGNDIHNVYLNDDSFPNKIYINLIKNILKKIFELDISSTKIYKQIMKNKKKSVNTTNTIDIFLSLFNKYCKKI